MHAWIMDGNISKREHFVIVQYFTYAIGYSRIF